MTVSRRKRRHPTSASDIEALVEQRSGEIHTDITEARRARHRAELGTARSMQRNGSLLARGVAWFDTLHQRNSIVEKLETLFNDR